MRRLSTSVRFALGALLAAALALSPAVVFAGAATLDQGAAMATDESAPCDMPCDHCGDGKTSFGCAVACSGLVASMPAPALAALAALPAAQAEAVSTTPLSGREREPDKPPPRRILG